MKNVSFKLPLLIFILVITSNLRAEARKLTGVELIAGSSSYAGTGMKMEDSFTPLPTCKIDYDCTLRCPKGGLCNRRFGTCNCF
ncbi:putative defensin-like protein 257 [Eutrema salsugineum]|uniref:putative defensin-like protein 257 n=1 Tax=Eutrema salsugineum TaxID=72664 RepID=UPI000CED43EF|nr:putative defensin-like protein 257 [Eutrema salsugineum]